MCPENEENVETTTETTTTDSTDSTETTEPKKSLAGTDFYKKKLNDTNSQLENERAERVKIQQELDQYKTKNLTEKEDYKQLWEIADKKSNEWEGKYNGLKNVVIDDKKTSAITQEALKHGIHENALYDLDLLDKTMVQIETTDRGNINVLGAKEYVEDLKTNRPHWFKNLSAPNVNTDSPGVGETKTDSKPNPQQLVAMKKENPDKYKLWMKKLYNVG